MSPSIHDVEDVPEAPDGWVGGDLVNTGGSLYARMWVHPQEELRVGYSVDEADEVGLDRVRFEGGEKSNPLSWAYVDDLRSEPCDGEADCLDTALELMESSVGD